MMGRKGKRRRRKRPARAAAPLAERGSPERTTAEPEPVEVPPEMGSAPEPPPRPQRRGLFGGGGAGIPSPYPPLGESLGQGFVAVGSSLPILVTAMLSVLILWGPFFAPPASIFVSRGLDPAALWVTILALPPVPLLLEALLLPAVWDGLLVGLSVFLAAVALRAVLFATITAMVVVAIRGERPTLRGAPGRLPAWSARLFAILSAEVGLTLAVFTLVQGFLGQDFAIMFVWIMGLYFLVFAPVILVAEDLPAAEVLRRTVRAARLPGMRHLSLVLVYFLFLFTAITSFLGPQISATPTILSWLIILGATFVHVGMLGALAYRWLAVRDQVPAGPAQRRRR